ncbi:MAG: PIN domain-containing protein [Verrucomicrobia bacterium]|nr:PIN domain-containing protein [Verrucomicrobiota bacterium]
MALSDLPDGVAAFVDANVFIYHFSGVSPECRDFLQRVEKRAVRATTGAHVLLEVLHRLMILEALAKGLIAPGQPAKKLKQRPDVIRQLRDYQRCVAEIRRLRMRVAPVNAALIEQSRSFRTAHGLMTNDSLTTAMMAQRRIIHLVSHDSDLKRVPGLMVHQPSDIQ